uniref:Transposase n=1 Tax=Ascaris lumbricoides TaxID=6252 RepID=A0A0M3IVP1_ASCLU
MFSFILELVEPYSQTIELSDPRNGCRRELQRSPGFKRQLAFYSSLLFVAYSCVRFQHSGAVAG